MGALLAQRLSYFMVPLAAAWAILSPPEADEGWQLIKQGLHPHDVC